MFFLTTFIARGGKFGERHDFVFPTRKEALV
jgi:hypothetical protein